MGSARDPGEFPPAFPDLSWQEVPSGRDGGPNTLHIVKMHRVATNCTDNAIVHDDKKRLREEKKMLVTKPHRRRPMGLSFSLT